MTEVRVVRVPSRPVRTVRVYAGPQGPAGMVWRGTWSAGATYVALDGVSHGGASYICTSAVGPTATNPGADAAHWSMFAAKGAQGGPGDAATITLNPTVTGAPGSAASVANTGTASAAKFTFTIPRGDVGPRGVVWRGTWAAGTAYVLGDGVAYSGSSYIAVAASTGQLPTNVTYWSPLAVKGTDGVGTGDVSGPGSAVDGRLAVFSGTTGKLIKDGGTVPTLASLGGAPAARTVGTAAGSGLTGGGDLSANRSLAADFGTTSGKVAQGNDSRFVGVGITDKSASYTLTAADAGTVIRSTAVTGITITVPNSTLSAGNIIEVLQYGAGQVTIAAGSGVTLRSTAAAPLKTAEQYTAISILMISASEAVVTGGLA